MLSPRHRAPESLSWACFPAADPHKVPIDPNGNLSTKVEGADTWTYAWNAENQLTKVEKNSVEQARFAYDPIGRRVEKVAGGVTTSYTYDESDVLREVRGASTLKYVHGDDIDEPLAVDDGTALSYFHADGLGSMAKMTTAAGAVTSMRQYDAWGNPEVGASEAGYAFTGREWDPETGLYYYRARHYDSRIGRFIGEDPIRWLAGPNLYSYVNNGPTRFTDPAGLITRARGEADRANAWIVDCWLSMGSAAGVFRAQNKRMRDNNAKKVDKYFHCMANCEASKMGPCGRGASHIFSYLREIYGVAKGDPWTDINEDMSANSQGRNCPQQQTCYERCKSLLPPRLPAGFRR